VIVDSSALIAIVTKEPGYDTLIEKLLVSPSAGMGTPTLTETGIVLGSRLGLDAGDLLARVVAAFDIVPVPFGEDHWREAVRAYVRFGRGRHPARLNFGDCLAYAIARLAGEPLLFVGTDFGHTDLEAA
jgi:ribonuclease VapC